MILNGRQSDAMSIIMLYIFRGHIQTCVKYCRDSAPVSASVSCTYHAEAASDVHSCHASSANEGASVPDKPDYTFSICEERNPVYGERCLDSDTVTPPIIQKKHNDPAASTDGNLNEEVHVYEEI